MCTRTSRPTSRWLFRYVRLILGGLVCLVALGCTQREIIGSNLKEDPKKRIEIGVQAANEYLKAGDTDNALRHVEKALELDPKNAGALQTMALIYTREGQVERAEEYYRKAVRYNPTLASTRNNYATLLYSQDRYKEAADQLEVAVKDLSYDNRGQALQNLAMCYLKLGRKTDAEATFQSAVRVDPALPRPLLELAMLLHDQEQYKLASRYLRDYSRLTKPSAQTLWLGVQIERQTGNSDALASYELALRNLYPKSRQYRELLESKSND